MKNKGFTLVEILVIVAIIGILVAVVLVFLTSAKRKANVASVKTSLNSVVPAAAMCRDGGGIILSGNGGANICSDTNTTNAKYPSIKVCGNNAGDTVFSVVNPGLPTWRITLTTCGFSDCNTATNAYCDATGCHFPPGGSCN